MYRIFYRDPAVGLTVECFGSEGSDFYTREEVENYLDIWMIETNTTRDAYEIVPIINIEKGIEFNIPLWMRGCRS